MSWSSYLASPEAFEELKREVGSSLMFTPLNPEALCLNCGQIGLKKCGKCLEALYCGRDCQVKHWRSEHKRVCGVPGAVKAAAEAAAEKSGVQYHMLSLGSKK